MEGAFSQIPANRTKQKLASTRPGLRGILNCPVAMAPSSLEDRVPELCAQVAATKTETELDVILPQLQAAIHDHILVQSHSCHLKRGSFRNALLQSPPRGTHAKRVFNC